MGVGPSNPTHRGKLDNGLKLDANVGIFHSGSANFIGKFV